MYKLKGQTYRHKNASCLETMTTGAVGYMYVLFIYFVWLYWFSLKVTFARLIYFCGKLYDECPHSVQ